MPANDFEKQVQQRLDDFQLNPSASVWEKVEEELRDKRKRRVIYFLLPLMIALLGFSVYYLFENAGKATVAATHTESKKTTLAISPSAADNINSPVTSKSETNASSLNETTQLRDAGKGNPDDQGQTTIENNKLNISYPVSKT